MKFKKGKWKYELPLGTCEIQSVFLRTKNLDFILRYITHDEIMGMRNREIEKTGNALQKHILYISMVIENMKPYLLIYPEPHASGELKIFATKMFEI